MLSFYTSNLTYSVGSVLGLKIMGRIPVRVEYDDGVGPGDVESDSTHFRGQQEQEYPIICVELSDQALPKIMNCNSLKQVAA
jgi:hypothetical protein